MIEIETNLKATCDRKTRFYDAQRNTFGLMPGRDGSCPGCTLGPGGCCDIPAGRKLPVCYVNKTISYSRAAKNVLTHNTELLKSQDEDGMVATLVTEFRRFVGKEITGANPRKQLYYRLHWSGDIFSVTYAKALARAMLQFPEVTFWNYTRSFFALEHLVGVPNLIQYLSLDVVNLEKGLEAWHAWSGPFDGRLSVCYMGPEKLEYSGPELDTCPADTGEAEVDGACRGCMKCLRGTPIWFKQK